MDDAPPPVPPEPTDDEGSTNGSPESTTGSGPSFTSGSSGPLVPPTRPTLPDPSLTGRLKREDALAHLGAGDAAMSTGDYRDAAAHFRRVVGFDDPSITAAALLGLGEARYRLDDDAAALATWESVLELGETPSTYPALRNVAAARVRAGDLPGAIDAYRQAERRAPPEDRAEIATRLGWLTKETGDKRASKRYFARGRGDAPLISVTMILLAATVIVSLSALLSAEGEALFDLFQLDKQAVADGEYWRLWTVTLLHGNFLHLFFNMYALYLAGPIVERWYGSIHLLLFYLVCAAAGSVASFVFGGNVPSVGASGAIFGLFGLLLAAGRVHHPVDRGSRALISQLGMLILINIVFGFVVTGIDNAAHLGGLAAGLWIGALIPPTRVPTMASLWQQPEDAHTTHVATAPVYVQALAIGAVMIAVGVGIAVGTNMRT